MLRYYWLWFGVFIVLNKLCICSITNYQVTSNNQFSEFIIDSFGLCRGGLITVNYNVDIDQQSLTVPQISNDMVSTIIYDSYILLLILNDVEVNNGWYSNVGTSDVNIQSVCNQPSLYRQQLLLGNGTVYYNISLNHANSAQYSVAIFQCRYLPESYQKYPISIDVTVEMKNPLPYSDQYTQLSIDQVMLIRVYTGEIIIYSLFLVAMLFQFYLSRKYMKGIHYLFVAVIITQLLLSIALYSGLCTYISTRILHDLTSEDFNIYRILSTR